MAEQGSPPSRSGRLPTAGRRGDPRATGRRHWDEPAGTDEENPPWAGPGVSPRWADQDARQRRAPARQGAGGHGGHARGDVRAVAGTRQDDEPGTYLDWEPGSRSRKAASTSESVNAKASSSDRRTSSP